MTRAPLRSTPLPSAGPPSPAADAAALAFRTLHRAAADLAAGTPILLTGETSLAVLAAETARPSGLAEFAALTDAQPLLLLAPARAAAVLHRPVEHGAELVGLRITAHPLEPGLLLSLADPTAGQPARAGVEPSGPLPASAPAALALAKLARLLPAVLVAPIGPAAHEVAMRLHLLSVAAADVEACSTEPTLALRRISEAEVPLAQAADARIIAYRATGVGTEHLAILIGRPEERREPLARVHSACFTGDLLDSLRCDCGAQLSGAIARIAEDGAGVLLYLAQEGRGIGLTNKLRAYRLQDAGLDTLEANHALGWGSDERNYQIAAAMLVDLGLRRVRLLTNNPDKLAALAAAGIEIAGREPLAFPPNGVNDRYLATKAVRLGHLLR